MRICKCVDDFREMLVYAVLAIAAEVYLCFVLSWHTAAIVGCAVLNLVMFIGYTVDFLYLCRTILLDKTGCSFAVGKYQKIYTWQEINIQHVKNASFLFGDSEISGEGVILSTHKIAKPKYIGAMTYCRFTHPFSSVFIRFGSDPGDRKKKSAKYVYGGFYAERSELMDFLKTENISVPN